MSDQASSIVARDRPSSGYVDELSHRASPQHVSSLAGVLGPQQDQGHPPASRREADLLNWTVRDDGALAIARSTNALSESKVKPLDLAAWPVLDDRLVHILLPVQLHVESEPAVLEVIADVGWGSHAFDNQGSCTLAPKSAVLVLDGQTLANLKQTSRQKYCDANHKERVFTRTARDVASWEFEPEKYSATGTITVEDLHTSSQIDTGHSNPALPTGNLEGVIAWWGNVLVGCYGT
ncbi:uncharacterized protein FIESC28_11380 [Fusarium coffeatum]|uniref:Uncharacterized protein n=1 Tax=Fusarium coffeatum TaxID=231269 RepID=A0A366QN63_9HYPO|nr:uncharacterized protein FIESC28_11380 [Fusarium coffeatum]RBR05330.1 hypothetical protein FIESC28_11380 [Fusarium coffeatum]